MKAAASPIRSTIPAEGARGFSLNYLLAMAVGALGVITLFGFTLVSLDGIGRLPPPQFANSLCVDEKLRFLRTSPVFDAPGFEPHVLLVGSSVSWRTFDSETVDRATNGRARPFNGGFCGLKVNESAFTARYFIARYPSIRDVVTILAPQDLTECRAQRTELFDPADVTRYVYGEEWAFPLYLKYFDPFAFAKNIAGMKQRVRFRWGLEFDRFGGLPIDTTEHYPDLVYGALDPFDSTCFEQLHSLAAEVRAGGRRLIVAMMPLHPAWVQRYDSEHRVIPEFERRIRNALAGTSAVIWSPGGAFTLHEEDYVDAIHIRWSAAKAYSRALVEETGLGQVESPTVVRN